MPVPRCGIKKQLNVTISATAQCKEWGKYLVKSTDLLEYINGNNRKGKNDNNNNMNADVK